MEGARGILFEDGMGGGCGEISGGTERDPLRVEGISGEVQRGSPPRMISCRILIFDYYDFHSSQKWSKKFQNYF